jgi:hypothetical protein
VKFDSGDHVVVLYRGGGTVWEAVRVIGGGFGQLKVPSGLRFCRDGDSICVADCNNNRASVFRVGDGGLVRHIATDLGSPFDVEEVEGGWLVACWASQRVEFVGDDGTVGGLDGGGRPYLGTSGSADGKGHGEFYYPTALAVVPGLGLAVRDYGNGRLQVFATPEVVAMGAMAPLRVAWMTTVARAVLHHQRGLARDGGV